MLDPKKRARLLDEGIEIVTLVWRGDLISAASLASLHGVERMGSSTGPGNPARRSNGPRPG